MPGGEVDHPGQQVWRAQATHLVGQDVPIRAAGEFHHHAGDLGVP